MSKKQSKTTSLTERPPVVTIMGHVDHGKTSLLDYIRDTKVVAREAGGITQHIGAYQATHAGKKITFIDTPGHAAFSKMRARGAATTDIVILVVAANDGVKPQTIESIRHIKEAQAPFIVAINKVDLPDINIANVKAQLAEHDVVVTDFGGDIEVVEISAKTGKNVDKLLDTILLMAELLELKADAKAPLQAIVIESSKHPNKGPIASVIVKEGTLYLRQDIFTEEAEGRVRALIDDHGQQLKEALPGQPVEIVGFKAVPNVGSIVKEVGKDYQTEVEKIEKLEANLEFGGQEDDFLALLEDKPKIKLLIKTDVQGTLEAILENLDEESVDLVDFGVGPVSEGDVTLAESTGATIVAFHVRVPKQIKNLAKTTGVRLKEYDVIYKLIEDLQKQMLKLMEPTIDEVVVGEAEILQIFEIKGEKIAGVKVKTGEIKKNDLFHLKRGDEIIANPVIKTMKHGKEAVDRIGTKNEGGLTFKNKFDFKEGDILVAYKKADL